MVPTVEDGTAQLAGVIRVRVRVRVRVRLPNPDPNPHSNPHPHQVTMGGVLLCCPVIARCLGQRKATSPTTGPHYSAVVRRPADRGRYGEM